MANDAEQTLVPKFRQKLEDSLAEPEPMCLAMVKVDLARCAVLDDGPEPAIAQWTPDLDEVMTVVQARLSYQLRRYDLMARVEEETFMMVVKTLADTRVLDARMFQLYAALTEPYDVAGRIIAVPVTMGAAVRLPAETASSLMHRTDKALVTASAAGGKAPVLI